MTRKQYYRKKVKRFHDTGEFHELTFSCYKQMTLLTNDEWRTRLCETISDALLKHAFQLNAFVLMPEHVHMLVLPTSQIVSVSRFLIDVKVPFSSWIKAKLQATNSPLLRRLTVRDRPNHEAFRFWQEGGGYDRNLYSAKAIEASVNYIHLNPVRRGLCKSPVEWQWSSARFYLLDPPLQQFEHLPVISPLPPDVFDRGSEK